MPIFSCCSASAADADKPSKPVAEGAAGSAPVPAAAAAAAPAATPAPAAAPTAKTTTTKATVKVWVVYYSMYGHIKKMADAIKEGIDSVDGCEAVLYQVPETLPQDVLAKMHAPPKSDDPVCDPKTLTEADAFFFGFPTRFGAPAAQFKNFWDATGQHWSAGALHSKPFCVFTSTATQNGGQETTLRSSLSEFVHHGMIYVPPGYITPGTNFDLTEVHGGSPFGPGCLAGPDGSRQPSAKELDFAKASGANLAKTAKKLKA